MANEELPPRVKQRLLAVPTIRELYSCDFHRSALWREFTFPHRQHSLHNAGEGPARPVIEFNQHLHGLCVDEISISYVSAIPLRNRA